MVFLLVLLQIVSFNPDGQMIAQHDTGNVIMRVTARGCIGDTVTPSSGNIINGFKYPRTGQNWLFFGGFAVGNSRYYVADGFFGERGIVARDFQVVDSLERVFRHNAQEWECRYNDLGHPAPRNLRVNQYSIASPNLSYDDGVLMEFKIENESDSTVNDLYAGLFFDFDMGATNLTRCGTDTIRRCVWMRQNTTENPTIGVKLLSPESWANLACIHNPTYIYPDTGLADSNKIKFLSGLIRVYSSTSDDDWTLCASVGPFSLEPHSEYKCAFAVLGGTSLTDFYANADSLQNYYNQISGIKENQLTSGLPASKLAMSNPVKENGRVQLQVTEGGKIALNLYDALGRHLSTIWKGVGPCDEIIELKTQNLPTGLYFLRLTTERAAKTLKVIVNK
ncbi:MAG: T9SS type A sorting domain-containing protein [candidate division WOR-3 bacterium]